MNNNFHLTNLSKIASSLCDFRTANVSIPDLELKYAPIFNIELEDNTSIDFRRSGNTLFADFNLLVYVQLPHKDGPSHLVAPCFALSATVTTAFSLISNELKMIAIFSKELNMSHRFDLFDLREPIKTKKYLFKALSNLSIEDISKKATLVNANEVFSIPNSTNTKEVFWKHVSIPKFGIVPIHIVWGLKQFKILNSIKYFFEKIRDNYILDDEKDYFNYLTDLSGISTDLHNNAQICTDNSLRLDDHDLVFKMREIVNASSQSFEHFYMDLNYLGSTFNAIHSDSYELFESNLKKGINSNSILINFLLGNEIPVPIHDYPFHVCRVVPYTFIVNFEHNGIVKSTKIIKEPSSLSKFLWNPEVRIFSNTNQVDNFYDFHRKYDYDLTQGFQFELVDKNFISPTHNFETLSVNNTQLSYKGAKFCLTNKPINEKTRYYGVLGLNNSGHIQQLSPLITFRHSSMIQNRALECLQESLFKEIDDLPSNTKNLLHFVKSAFQTVDQYVVRFKK